MATYVNQVMVLEKMQQAAATITELMKELGLTINEAALVLEASLQEYTKKITKAAEAYSTYANGQEDPISAIYKLIPALKTHYDGRCPADPKACWGEDKQFQEYTNVVMHLNDEHKWPRETILDWLEKQGVDLTVNTSGAEVLLEKCKDKKCPLCYHQKKKPPPAFPSGASYLPGCSCDSCKAYLVVPDLAIEEGKEVKSDGYTTGASAEDVADALYFLAGSGLDYDE